jgi:hypothetical protein
MARDIRVRPVAGQRVIIDPVEPETIARTVTSKAKDLQTTYVTGTYVAPPPPEPPLTYATSIAAGAKLAGKVEWLATVLTGTAVGFDFLVDGVVHWHELAAPWGGTFDTTALANGKHILTVVGFDADGAQAPVGGEVTIDNAVIPPIVIPDKSVPVSSVSELRRYLADNTVDEIICEDGRYVANGGTGAGSLWIGSQAAGGTPFAERTKPVLVRARNALKAILEGGYLSFEDGAHDQVWDGFRHSNMTVTSNGVINFGGYFARRAPHHITMRNGWIDDTCKASHGPNASQDHAIYPAHSLGGGPGFITVEDYRIDAANLNGALHSWHPEPGQEGAPPHDLTYRRILITDPWWGIVGGHTTAVRNFLFEDIRIEGARRSAIAWDLVNPESMLFRRVVTVRSKQVFEHRWSAKPLPPGIPGMTFEDCSFA